MSARRTPTAGARGWPGRGGGQAVVLDPPPMWRGTSVQVCGLHPFAVGAGTPAVGVPLGRTLTTGSTLCCDPISWFQRAHLISNPSAFVLGRPGLGKSTVLRRWALGLAGFGVLPMVLGDLKPDHVKLGRAIGAQVIELGNGRGFLNVLDPGEARAAAEKLTGDRRRAILADAHGRRRTMVAALLTIARGAPPSDREESVIDAALRELDDNLGHVPVLADLLAVIKTAPESVRSAAVDRGNLDKYLEVTEHLEASLYGLVHGGRLGEMFSQPTSEPIRRDKPVVFDISGIDEGETDLQAAALLACWSTGFASVAISQVLADAGLEPRRHRFVVLDELWRVLRSGRGMVDRVDAITRLNRTVGVGQVMASHTMSDLTALPDEADRMKAKGFVERAGMVVCGGLPPSEVELLRGVIDMSDAEEKLLAGWQDPPAWDSRTGAEAAPPGRGHFLVKVGGRPGIPFVLQLTDAERAVNDTNERWHEQSRISAGVSL